MLTLFEKARHTVFAAEKEAAGFDSLTLKGGRTASRAVFLRPLHRSPMGGPCGEPQGSPGPFSRSVNPHGSVHPFDRGWAGKQKTKRRQS